MLCGKLKSTKLGLNERIGPLAAQSCGPGFKCPAPKEKAECGSVHGCNPALEEKGDRKMTQLAGCHSSSRLLQDTVLIKIRKAESDGEAQPDLCCFSLRLAL